MSLTRPQFHTLGLTERSQQQEESMLFENSKEALRFRLFLSLSRAEEQGKSNNIFSNAKSCKHMLTVRYSLDLTAASRAYLMEPQWNPMMEEQALCRVYRMGQKKDVTVIRYRMRDSFENVCLRFPTFESSNSRGA